MPAQQLRIQKPIPVQPEPIKVKHWELRYRPKLTVDLAAKHLIQLADALDSITLGAARDDAKRFAADVDEKSPLGTRAAQVLSQSKPTLNASVQFLFCRIFHMTKRANLLADSLTPGPQALVRPVLLGVRGDLERLRYDDDTACCGDPPVSTRDRCVFIVNELSKAGRVWSNELRAAAAAIDGSNSADGQQRPSLVKTAQQWFTWLGGLEYRFPDGIDELVLDATHCVLQVFLKRRQCTGSDLTRLSGVDYPDRVLKRLVKRIGASNAIDLPGGHRKRGYKCFVRHEGEHEAARPRPVRAHGAPIEAL